MGHQRYSLSLCFANGSIGGESAVTTVTAVTAVAEVAAVTTVATVATVTEPLMAKCFPALALCFPFLPYLGLLPLLLHQSDIPSTTLGAQRRVFAPE